MNANDQAHEVLEIAKLMQQIITPPPFETHGGLTFKGMDIDFHGAFSHCTSQFTMERQDGGEEPILTYFNGRIDNVRIPVISDEKGRKSDYGRKQLVQAFIRLLKAMPQTFGNAANVTAFVWAVDGAVLSVTTNIDGEREGVWITIQREPTFNVRKLPSLDAPGMDVLGATQ